MCDYCHMSNTYGPADPDCPECGCPRSYHFRNGKPTGCVMADAGGGNCACTYYRRNK